MENSSYTASTERVTLSGKSATGIDTDEIVVQHTASDLSEPKEKFGQAAADSQPRPTTIIHRGPLYTRRRIRKLSELKDGDHIAWYRPWGYWHPSARES